MSYRPESVSHVAPYLVVQDPVTLIKFLEVVFEAKETLRHHDSNGKINHVQVNIEESTIMIGQATDAWKPNPSMLHVYVEDVDDTMAKALKNGASVTLEAEYDKQAGDRRGMVAGPQGNYWAIASKMM